MSKVKAPHHKGTYHTRSAKVRAAAYANPDTRCWRCRLTLQQVRRIHPRAKWTAGHLVDGQEGGALAPECSWCNYSNGARLRHQAHPRHHTANW